MNPYHRLDPRIQKWVFKQGWPDLRQIQKATIAPILAGGRDVLISAATAAGKTEAFFLPALTATADQEDGFGILYLSPLKALINDQYRRLEGLCEMLDMPVTPWHGDASQSRKRAIRKRPAGVLLITPESLEALLINHAGWARQAFANLQHVVIDEFHAFIGLERGQQLLSLLNRLDHLLGRLTQPVPRTALSATLGDLESVPASLRPNGRLPCDIITADSAETTLRVQVRGYRNPSDLTPDDESAGAEYKICQDLYQLCRGDSHLVFANSRGRTEAIAAQLSDFCDTEAVPNEFFPHHGSLSKDIRHDLERRLQKETLPTTGICTMTLELGIDIGKVSSVIQVNAPPSVSSLRQRTGRSGRRGEPAILRALIAEQALTPHSSLNDHLRLELVQAQAMIRLLICEKWFEPADNRQFHFSTLTHQILSMVAQWGGVRADQLYALLCRNGPFQQIGVDHFKQLLTHLGEQHYLTQLSSGELVLGLEGERLVGHYSFYSVFRTPEEFRVVSGSRTIGTVPVDSPILPDQHIIFGGRRWKVLDINVEDKVIHVKKTKGGKPPKFGGSGAPVHTVVRREMLAILTRGDYRIETPNGKIDFINSQARTLFQEAADFSKDRALDRCAVLRHGNTTCVLPWLGDKAAHTLAALLTQAGFQAANYGGIIEVDGARPADVETCYRDLLSQGLPAEAALAEKVPEKHLEKFDELLPEPLLNEGFGRKMFDCCEAHDWLRTYVAPNDG